MRLQLGSEVARLKQEMVRGEGLILHTKRQQEIIYEEKNSAAYIMILIIICIMMLATWWNQSRSAMRQSDVLVSPPFSTSQFLVDQKIDPPKTD